MKNETFWMVRAGRDSVYVDDFLNDSVAAIGWVDLGELPPKCSKTQLVELYKQAHPNDSTASVANGVGQITRFADEITIGDGVATYDRDKRLYYLGKIKGKAQWQPQTIPNLPRAREVEWTHKVPRDALSKPTRNTLGAIQTLFSINADAAADLHKHALAMDANPDETSLPIIPVAVGDAEVETAEIPASGSLEIAVEFADEAIEERIVRLDWENMQELVAGVLRAMGYRTSISPRGADQGVDIFASPDGLGLQEPRIFVEVKHRPNTSMGSPEIRSFLGGRSAGDKCLYVSTGGFTREARYEAQRANVPIQLLGLTELRRLIVDYYEELDEPTRRLIPLRRVYIPIE